MNRGLILIISVPDDGHVPSVARLLDAAGAPYHWLTLDELSRHSHVELVTTKGRMQAFASWPSYGRIDLSKVRAVWYRRPGLIEAGAELGPTAVGRYVIGNAHQLVLGLWEMLDCPWLPGKPLDEERATNKPLQLKVATQIGFRVPRTRVTSSPRALLDAYAECRGQVIIKPLAPYHDPDRPDSVQYSRAVARRQLRGYRGLLYAPMIVQERIVKRFDIRVTVVGDEVFATEIDSQANPRTAVDFRHFDWSPAHQPHALPRALKKRCLDLVKRLDLRFGAIDMVLTPSGDYVFLEINGNGQWLWLEHLTRQPIAAAVARLLLKGS